jgi:VanZ family protein
MKSLTFARSAVLIFFLLILAGSSVPGKNIPKIFEFTPDKLIHCAEYFVLGCLLFRWHRMEFAFVKFNTTLFVTIGLGAMAGAIDENYQRLIPGRIPDIWDWMLDTIGVILSAAFMHFLINKKSPA